MSFITDKNIKEIEKLLKVKDKEKVLNLDIQLFDGNNYTAHSLKILDFVLKELKRINNSDDIQININVLNEKLPKKVFLKVYNFYKSAKSYAKIYIAVKHGFEKNDFKDEEKKVWDIDTIIKANLQIQKVCDFIKDNKFSPMEALAYIHLYVSSVANYNSSNNLKHEWCDNDQFFAGAYLKMPEIVCMGYCSLMKEIIDNLGMQELKCDIISIQFEHLKKGYNANHARCFIEVKDKKYGINQSFFDDPTWDSFDNSLKYCHFAMPNNCHDLDISNMYDYRKPNLIQNNPKDNVRRFNHEVIEKRIFNKSKNSLNQKTVEEIFYTVLQKMHPKSSCKEIKQLLNDMANNSYKEQIEREYSGNLKQTELLLNDHEINLLYKKNNSDIFKSQNINENLF